MEENAMRYLGESGLADKIIAAKTERNVFKIKFNHIPINVYSHGHRSSISEKPKERNYYRFVENFIKTVIALVDDDNSRCVVRLNSKCLNMDGKAVKKFEEGWKALQEKYKQNKP